MEGMTCFCMCKHIKSWACISMCWHVSRAERVCTCLHMICVFWLVLTGDCVSSDAGLYQRLGVHFHVYARIRRLNVRQHLFCTHGKLDMYLHSSFVYWELSVALHLLARMCMWICWNDSRARHVTTREPLTARLATDPPRTC